jgi:hypothetical protein
LIVIDVFTHVAEMRDRNADLADFTLGQRMIAVVTGLRRQIEGNRKPGLPFAQVLAVKRVRRRRRGVPGVSAKDPRFVALLLVAARLFAHRFFARLGTRARTLTRPG